MHTHAHGQPYYTESILKLLSCGSYWLCYAKSSTSIISELTPAKEKSDSGPKGQN